MLERSSRKVALCNAEYGVEMGKPLRDGQRKKFKGTIEFQGVNYPTMDSLKAVFKALIVKTKNDAPIEEPGHSQVDLPHSA